MPRAQAEPTELILYKLERIAMEGESLKQQLVARFSKLLAERDELLLDLAKVEGEITIRAERMRRAVAVSVAAPAKWKAARTLARASATAKPASRSEASAPKAAAPEEAGSAPAGFPPLPDKPAVPVSESILGDVLVCLIDGERRKMLHRHIKSRYGITPEQYRAHFELPDDYPMTAPGYSKSQSRAISEAIVDGRVPHRTKLREKNELLTETGGSR